MTTTRIRSTRALLIAPLSAALLLAGCAGAPEADKATTAASATSSSAQDAEGPITLENCGTTITLAAPAQRAVSLNQGATEQLLALGLEDRMVGTAYLDSPVPEKWAKAYAQVPVLSEKYPDKETLLAAQPDLVVASYASAYGEKGVGTREELAGNNIQSYVSIFACPIPKDEAEAAKSPIKRAEATWDNVFKEQADVASLFGKQAVVDAEKLNKEQADQVSAIEKLKAGEGLKIFWYDSGTDTPFVGAGSGGPQLLINTVGAENIFGDLKGNWKDGSWETVIASNPDVIVFADADWDTAAQKIEYLKNDPVLSQLAAVQQERFVIIPFAATTPGAELVDGAQKLSDGIAQLKK